MRNFFGAHRRLVVVLAGAVVLAAALGTMLGIIIASGHGTVRHAASSGGGVERRNPVASLTSTVAASASPAWRPSAAQDPRLFALAYATALFSYDTRDQDEPAWTATLTGLLDPTADVHTQNLGDVADRTPPVAVWAAMARSAQRATFAPTNAWVPQLWTRNASQYPPGADVVTVTGVQHVASTAGSSNVASSVTLLLICPPFNNSCVVNRITPQVLP
jgi:hypothetical protein